MKLIKYPDRSQWNEILKRPVLETENLFDTVRNIINRVRAGGDRVVMEYEAVFDKAELTSLAVTSAEIEEAEKEVPIELKAAIYLAKRNIETFHSAQRFEGKKVDTMEGVTCWQKAVAIEKVGLYIPGGTAPLFSTVLMLAIPAKIAGCKEIVLCTPPDKNERYILLSCLPLVWLESAKSLRLVEYRPLPLWLTGQRVFLKFIRSLVPAISMSPLPSNLSACGMSPLICLRGRRR